MNKRKIKILRHWDNSKIPMKAHEDDACYDVVATSKKVYEDGRIEYTLGFSLQPEQMSDQIQFDLRPRSSIHKKGMILSNCIGTGDKGYTGEYKAIFYKIIPSLPDYEVGDKILQLQATSSIPIDFVEVKNLENTERGEGGFGSTGDKPNDIKNVNLSTENEAQNELFLDLYKTALNGIVSGCYSDFNNDMEFETMTEQAEAIALQALKTLNKKI